MRDSDDADFRAVLPTEWLRVKMFFDSLHSAEPDLARAAIVVNEEALF